MNAEPRDPGHLSFVIGEEIAIKGHIFKVVGMGPHELRLRPVHPVSLETTADIRDNLTKLKIAAQL